MAERLSQEGQFFNALLTPYTSWSYGDPTPFPDTLAGTLATLPVPARQHLQDNHLMAIFGDTPPEHALPVTQLVKASTLLILSNINDNPLNEGLISGTRLVEEMQQRWSSMTHFLADRTGIGIVEAIGEANRRIAEHFGIQDRIPLREIARTIIETLLFVGHMDPVRREELIKFLQQNN